MFSSLYLHIIELLYRKSSGFAGRIAMLASTFTLVNNRVGGEVVCFIIFCCSAYPNYLKELAGVLSGGAQCYAPQLRMLTAIGRKERCWLLLYRCCCVSTPPTLLKALEAISSVGSKCSPQHLRMLVDIGSKKKAVVCLGLFCLMVFLLPRVNSRR